MKSKEIESGFSIIKKEDLSLSNKVLAELLQSTLVKGVPFRFKVKGFSMSPIIKDSDEVTISPLLNSSVGFGKSVAFIHPKTGKLIIHRVIAKRNNSYLIKADNAIKPDGLISEEDILGCVTRVERNGKEVFLGLGPERFIIAFLSRRSLFLPLLFFLRRFVRPGIKRFKHE